MNLIQIIAVIVIISSQVLSGQTSTTKEQNPDVLREAYCLLGMTTEYMGHRIGSQGRLSWASETTQKIFDQHFTHLSELLGGKSKQETNKFLDSFYVKTYQLDTPTKFQAESSIEMFKGQRQFYRDYIAGAVITHWDPSENVLRLANAEGKAELLMILMKEFSPESVTLTFYPNIPHVFVIKVNGSKEFQQFVEQTLKAVK